MIFLRYLTFFLRLCKIILATCGFNLLIIGTIIGLLTFIDQGAPLLVDLLVSPGNVLLFWFIIMGTALAYGHYPVYSYKWKTTYNLFRGSDQDTKTVWILNPPEICGLGIITYSEPKSIIASGTTDEDISRTKTSKAFHSFRGLLGLAFILSIFYCLVFCYQKFIGSDEHTLWFSGVFIVLFGLYYTINLKPSWIRPSIKWTFTLFLVMVLINLALSSTKSVWNPSIFWTFSIALTCLALFYILLKKYRARLENNQLVLANHVHYLIMISLLGWISFLTIIFSQFYPSVINPIVILLAYFNVVYGMYVITLKHRLYYLYKEVLQNADPPTKNHPVTSTFFRLITPLILILIAIWIALAGIRGNNLHQLELTPDAHPMTLDEFHDHVNHQIISRHGHDPNYTERDTLYFIASYGGGLKANAWNLMVMDTLAKLGILESTIAISGVSGGNIGQFIYGSLEKVELNDKNNKINQISTYNFLSRDLAWLMGWDFIRELDLFSEMFRPDRARKSLKIYQDMVGDQQMTNVGMRSYWKSIFDKKGHYPILISNSSGVNIRRGICCSVKFPDTGITFDQTFPGAVNLLEFKNSPGYSLSYLGAASTSNRFPLLSPAAKIPNKGHFVDGGYFENSGMFSLLNFYEALNRQHSWNKIFDHSTVIFIQIANHKSTYLRQLIPDSLLQIDEIEEAGEILQVLETKASTEFLPYYFEQKVKYSDSINVVRINLPYKVTLPDIKKQFHARTLNAVAEHKINKIIENNDRYIDSLYSAEGITHWDAIEPATARLLSEPAVNYMHMVIHHDDRIVRFLQDKK